MADIDHDIVAGNRGLSTHCTKVCENCGEENGYHSNLERTKCEKCGTTCYGFVDDTKLLQRLFKLETVVCRLASALGVKF